LSQLGRVDVYHPFRNNFVVKLGSGSLYSSVLFIQLFGSLLATYLLFRNRSLIKNKVIFSVLMVVSLILVSISSIVFYLVAIFNPSFP